MTTYDLTARLLKTLGHPARLAILAVLRDGEECVCHLEAHLGFRQAYISQHLMLLREAGLVRDRREGSNIFYCITEPGLYAVLDAALKLTGRSWPIPPREAGRQADCACPKCQPVQAPVLVGPK